MAKAMKINDRTFLVFRQEVDVDARYRKPQAIGKYVVMFSENNWILLHEDSFEHQFRFSGRESPNGFSEVEIKTS